jgi:GH25 family lysozyme M1 (1,4-beta-N-acetylmuramidase)
VRTKPIVHPSWVNDGSMAKPRRLVQQSDLLRSAIDHTADPTVANGGWKTWSLTPGLARHDTKEGSEQAFNHGLYTKHGHPTPGGEKAIQVIGGAHGRLHIDYSQVVVLMSATCILDGETRHTEDLLTDQDTARLLSDEGVITVTRQPGSFDVSFFGGAAPAPAVITSSASATVVLRRGSTGPDVRRWQAILDIVVDGIFGKDTEAATRTWQAEHGLVPDGVVGARTWAAAASGIAAPGVAAGTILEGIDVSVASGAIDWPRVKAAGIQFAVLRASVGVDSEDRRLRRNAEGARAAGIPIGAYHVVLPRAGVQDAEKQARQFVEHYRRVGCTLRPAADCENSGATRGRKGSEWAGAIRTWLHVVESELGQKPFIYTYPAFWASIPELRDATCLGTYPLWIAHYAPPPRAPIIPPPWKTKAAWQYAAGVGVIGRVDGLNGPVDRNRFWGTLDELTIA